MGSPKRSDPTVLETIFASPVVVGAARIVVLSAAVVLLFAGLYIAASILYRMRHGQWLQRAGGPFEAHLAEEGRGRAEGAEDLAELFAETVEENAILRAKLTERDRQARELT